MGLRLLVVPLLAPIASLDHARHRRDAGVAAVRGRVVGLLRTVAAASCALLAAACVDDISSTSGDKLSAAEFASMSSARNELVMAIRFGGVPCPAGGSVATSTDTIVLHTDSNSSGWSSAGTHAVTDCAVTWDDGVTWTFASRGLIWTSRVRTTRPDGGIPFFTYDATMSGPLSWSRDGKRGGCLVDLSFRARGSFGVYDSRTVRGQACGARVDLAFSY